MNSLTTAEVKHVSDLIRIQLSEAEIEAMQETLSVALDPASQLNSLDTENVDVLSHPTGLVTTGVADEVEDSLSSEDALRNAAGNGNVVLGYIRVPKDTTE